MTRLPGNSFGPLALLYVYAGSTDTVDLDFGVDPACSAAARLLLACPSRASPSSASCCLAFLFYEAFPFNVDITRATVLTIVGESVRSLLFVIMLTHLVSGHFSHNFLRDSSLYNHDQQVLGCKLRDFPAALALGASLLLRRSIGIGSHVETSCCGDFRSVCFVDSSFYLFLNSVGRI